MYPMLPTETLAGSLEFVCYFFSMLAAALGLMFTRT
jgi:hypothetical protein